MLLFVCVLKLLSVYLIVAVFSDTIAEYYCCQLLGRHYTVPPYVGMARKQNGSYT